MKSADPQVSVNIITHNRENFLSTAIDSVLTQSFEDWELIIVDDYSTDNTSLLMSKYVKKDSRIKYFKNNINLGISKSRNLALGLSSGNFVAVLDSDDYWLNTNKLQLQVDFLNSSNYVLVGSNCQLIDNIGNKIGYYFNNTTDKQIRNSFLFKNQFVNSSVLFLKKIAVDSGAYDEKLSIGEDYDLFLRIGEKGKIANLNDILVAYRQHDGNVTSSKTLAALEDNLTIIKRYKDFYPNYFFALARRFFRLYFFKIFIKKS